MPPVKEYLKAKQKNGKDLVAEQVYKETWNWLRERGCEKNVSPQLIDQYAMSVSRWIQKTWEPPSHNSRAHLDGNTSNSLSLEKRKNCRFFSK